MKLLKMLLRLIQILFVLFQKIEKEITTEGGLNISKNKNKIKK